MTTRFDKVMDNLSQVPEVKKHMNKLQVQLAKQISKERIQQGLTQKELVNLIKENGETITQAQLSKIETGIANINISTYEKVLDILGYEKVEIDFKNRNTSRGSSPRIAHEKRRHGKKPRNNRKLVHTEQELIKS